MRRFIYILISSLLTLMSCHRQETLRRAAWKPAGGEFDSLTEKMEWQFNDYAPYDSIARTIARMESIANSDSTNRRLRMSRTLYWKARYNKRIENSGKSMEYITQAIQLNDSTTYEYDRLKFLTLLYTQCDTINGGKQYKLYEYCLEYAKKIKDKSFESYSAIIMGNLLSEIEENDKALHFFNLADSLNQQIGYYKLVEKNKINKASIYSNCGDTTLSDSLLLSMESNNYIFEDTLIMNAIPRNLYVRKGDIKYLRKAYNQIKNNIRFRELQALYQALLVNYHYNNENLDSMAIYSSLAKNSLHHVLNPNFKALIWKNLSLYYIVFNKLDSALICRVNYEMYVDSIITKRQATEVLRLSALHEMKAMEKDYADATFRRTMVWAFVIVVLIAAGVIMALMLNRRHIRARMLAMEKELQLEKTRRKVTATTLSIQEKDQLLDVLKNELSDMRRDGGIKEQNARQLESTIKSHLLEHDTEETFQDMFDTVNPDFTRRLRERCPGIADSYVNLACYILMELDNKKIARLMNIKPESVHQSRWRLRQRLHLAEGETLEDALRTLNTPSYLQK